MPRLTARPVPVHSVPAASDASGAGRDNPNPHRRTKRHAGAFLLPAVPSMATGAGQASAWPVPMCRFVTPASVATIPRRDKRAGGSLTT
jgi:hypothetical protein